MDRTKAIGGSDIAAICGVSPWKTAYQVWEEKLGLSQGQEDNQAMAYGRLMEGTIRQWYTNETGRTVVVPSEMLQHSKYPFIRASLDGKTDDRRVVEIKTARSGDGWGEPGTDEIPVYYMTQVQEYCLLTGFDVADVVVSIAGTFPVIYEVRADKELQEIILERCIDFWQLVQSKTPPDPVSYADVISRFGKQSRATVVTATQEVEEAVYELRKIKEVMKTLEEEEKKVKTVVMKAMAENDTLLNLAGNVLATWKKSKDSKGFDEKKFKSEKPEIYQEYLKEVAGSRRFLLK